MQRRRDIDLAKGVAILLVVFGHLVARQDPADVAWYEPLRRVVYSFHMPFLLYLSGVTAASSGLLARPRAGWAAAARRQAVRLLLPFFGVGLVILIAKLGLARVLRVDNAPTGPIAGLAGCSGTRRTARPSRSGICRCCSRSASRAWRWGRRGPGGSAGSRQQRSRCTRRRCRR
jgi:hypothetical protein